MRALSLFTITPTIYSFSILNLEPRTLAFSPLLQQTSRPEDSQVFGLINGLEGFWGYLKRKLAAKGGIRQEHLHLYLGEYVWRYNYRHMNLKEQENYLMKLLKKYIR